MFNFGTQFLQNYAQNVYLNYQDTYTHAIALKTAVDAKTAKIDKKLKMVELQLRKARMDNEKGSKDANVLDASDMGLTGNRNDIVQAILNRVGQNK